MALEMLTNVAQSNVSEFHRRPFASCVVERERAARIDISMVWTVDSFNCWFTLEVIPMTTAHPNGADASIHQVTSCPPLCRHMQNEILHTERLSTKMLSEYREK